MWISNCWNNYAPYSGFMLRGLREELRCEATAKEDARAKGETAGKRPRGRACR
jgi:hypothetical protein